MSILRYIFIDSKVEGGMKEPDKFKSVLMWSMISITVMYLIAGTSGYLTYGNLSVSPVTLNLPMGITRTICNLVVTVHVILAIPILITTFSMDMERYLDFNMQSEDHGQFLKRICLRVGIMVAIVFVSCTIPYFSDLMTLIGAVANTLLIFIFPVIFHLKLFPNVKRPLLYYILTAFILTVGIIGGSMGTLDALKALYHDITK